MLDPRVARELADQLDLAALPACLACLFELAWAMHEGRPLGARARIAARTADWVWPEIEDELRAGVVELRMREVAGAEEGLQDLAERAAQGTLFRVVIERLAQQIADEIVESDCWHADV